MFCRALVIIRGKTSHISWRHSTFLESPRQRRWSSAISWRQNHSKIAERDRSHVIAVLQRLKRQNRESTKGIRGEKSSKDKARLMNLVSTMRTQASPKMGGGGRNQESWRVSVSCWHAKTIANAPLKPLIIRWRSSSVSRSWNWWKVWLVGKSLLVKGQNVN